MAWHDRASSWITRHAIWCNRQFTLSDALDIDRLLLLLLLLVLKVLDSCQRSSVMNATGGQITAPRSRRGHAVGCAFYNNKCASHWPLLGSRLVPSRPVASSLNWAEHCTAVRWLWLGLPQHPHRPLRVHFRRRHYHSRRRRPCGAVLLCCSTRGRPLNV